MTLLGRVVVMMLVTAAPAALAQQAAPLQLEGSAAPTPWQRYSDWTKAHWDNYSTLAKPDATPIATGAAKEGDY